MENTTIWALLVGINEYISPNVRTLTGCVNDVLALQQFLTGQMNVPPAQIKVLVNKEATREAIISSFRGFLIENPHIPKDSQLLFHYSGHGSQMRDTTGTEPDGLDETIVPHDSRTGNIFDIPDKTLGALIDQLAVEKGDHITVILDSCHSGSGTREIHPEGAAPTRRAPADHRLPPSDLDANLRPKTSVRATTRSGWAISRQNHVLIAGCLDREESNEYRNADGITYGALTWFSLEYLRQKPPGASYSDWHTYAMRRVNAFFRNQTPQCEGQRDRAIFGDAFVESDPFIPVKRNAGENRFTAEAGLLLGINTGTELAVYPGNVTSKQNLPKPLFTIRIESVTATASTAVCTGSFPTDLPKVIHGLVTKQVYSGIRQKVALMHARNDTDKSALQTLRNAILNSGGNGIPSVYLDLTDDSDQPSDLRVTAVRGELTIKDDKGKILVMPADFNQGGVGPVLHALESIARYHALLELSNQQSTLSNCIRVSLSHCTPEASQGDDLLQKTIENGEKLVLHYDPGDPSNSRYLVTITNSSTVDVYPYLFYLGPDYSIGTMYPPSGVNQALKPDLSLPIRSPEFNGCSIEVYLPGVNPGEVSYWDSSNDCLKLIVTTQPNMQLCEILKQGPLEVPPPMTRATGARRDVTSPLEQLLENVTKGTRHVRPKTINTNEDWTTVTIPFTVMRMSSGITLDKTKKTFDLGDHIILEKPPGFAGKITVAPLEEVRRGISDEHGLKLPPGFSGLQDAFQPVIRSGTRGLSGQPLVFTLETDDASRNLITPENPLKLRIPDEKMACDFLPVAFDGEDFLPVGYGTGSDTLDIVSIPESMGQPGQRGIGKAIKLFVYKKLGRPVREMGLRCAENLKGMVTYSNVSKNSFKKGDHVAVLVHGFLSDTSWMVRDVIPLLSSQNFHYNHFLTWDFETFGTSMEVNGADLATALRQQCGFNTNDGLTVHIYGHSAGSIVARCMVEISGGHEFVDRLILAGPPNRGTMLANLSRSFVYLLSGMINNISSIPYASAITWPFKELYEQGTGWKDLTVDSDLCRKLNDLEIHFNVPYLVLAGTNDLNQIQGARLNRLAHKILDKTLDTVFGETENDAVVGMKSMTGVRNGTYPALKIIKTDCNHFGYFANQGSRDVIQEWITK